MTDQTWLPDAPAARAADAAGFEALDGASFPPARSALHGALLESRGRWRDLVLMSADFAFETDRYGRLVFVAPDPALGWGAAALLGQSAELLLPEPARGDGAPAPGFNPFRPQGEVRNRRTWLRRQDGRVCCLQVSAAPLHDEAGQVVGARGIGADLTEQDGEDAGVAAALRRAQVVDHILARMREEVMAPRAMQAVLSTLASALGAEGAAVLDVLGAPSGQTPAREDKPRGATALHHTGNGLVAVLDTAFRLCGPPAIASGPSFGPSSGASMVGKGRVRQGEAPQGQDVLAALFDTRFGGTLALALWRAPGSRPWDEEDRQLALAVASVALVLLEHETVQNQMALQARTDPLTGLLNRRAFLEELPRHIARLDRDEMPGTLIFADLDHFKTLNDQLGHDAGDQALAVLSNVLRATFRPTDLIARLGGDEFAVWLNGADQLTAAERAEALRVQTPRALGDITGADLPPLNMSIGIAARNPHSVEDMDSLLRRADLAMYEVKRAGRAHWRTAPPFDG